MAGVSFIQSAADDIQHLADGLHGLGQILHDLHSEITSKRECVIDSLQVADAGGHLADILHGLQNVLLHSHIHYLQSLSGKGLLNQPPMRFSISP
jgi:hypothetical protein